MAEFRAQAQEDASTALLSLMVYVFDQVNQDVAVVPPKGWSLDDLLGFLEHIPVGLKRWTWEDAGRTRGAEPVKWQVENEYHVQNLLYVLLAPVFNDIADEVNLQPVGQKNPRIDLYLPSLHTIIEVKYRKDVKKSFPTLIGEIAEDASLYRADTKYKDARIVSFLWDRTRATQEHAKFKEGVLKKYRKDTKKSFPTLIGEIAEDASLYRADTKYKDARIVSFLWDCTRATQEHAKFKEGVLKIDGIDGCVVISAPSTMS